MRKEPTTLNELEAEFKTVQEAIIKQNDEINAKRRALSELKARLTDLEAKINAKKYEALIGGISEKTGLDMERFMAALEKGNVLVDGDVSEGHTNNEK